MLAGVGRRDLVFARKIRHLLLRRSHCGVLQPK